MNKLKRLAVMSTVLMMATFADSIEIKDVKFISYASDSVVKESGNDYGIYLVLQSSTKDILNDEGKYTEPLAFIVDQKNPNSKPIKITVRNKYHSEKKDDPDNPRIVDFYIFGSIDPKYDYVLTAKFGTEMSSVELKSSSEVAKVVSSWADNSMDLNISLSPLLNKVDKFNAEYHIDTELFGCSYIRFMSKGTLNNDATLKNGFESSLSIDYFNLYDVGLGKAFNRGYYFWKALAGINAENNQKLSINKYFGFAEVVFEIPYTNIPSMQVHKKYNVLRAAPGLMLSMKYMQPIDTTGAVEFSKSNRGDVAAEYNLSLNPKLFLKSRFVWYFDFDLSYWLNYRENTLGIVSNHFADSYYFIKYVNGYYATDFNLVLDELTLGITKKF